MKFDNSDFLYFIHQTPLGLFLSENIKHPQIKFSDHSKIIDNYLQENPNNFDYVLSVVHLSLNIFLQSNCTGPPFTKLTATDKLSEDRLEEIRKTSKDPQWGASDYEEIVEFWQSSPFGHPDDRVGESSSNCLSDKDLKSVADVLSIDGDLIDECVRGIGYLWLSITLSLSLACTFNNPPLGESISQFNPATLANCPMKLRLIFSRVAYVWQHSLSGLESSPQLAQIYLGQFLSFLEKSSLVSGIALFPIINGDKSLDDKWREYGPSVEECVQFVSNLRPQEISALLVELSLRLSHFGRSDVACIATECAAKVIGMKFEFGGEMGKRRKYQSRLMTQLVVRVTTTTTTTSTPVDLEVSSSSVNSIQLSSLDDSTDILESPEFQTNDDDSSLAEITGKLNSEELFVLLSYCYAILRSHSMHDELALLQLRSVVERCLAGSPPQSYLVHSCCLLFRTRTDYKRSKTVERGAAQLQTLVDQYKLSEPSSSIRLKDVFIVPYPLRTNLIREMGSVMSKVGCFMGAYEMYAEAWMWEDAVESLILAGRKAMAEDVLQERLTILRTPRLCCCKGEVSDDYTFFEEAWALSGNKYARAQRSLGRHWLKAGELFKAIAAFKLSLNLNPMYHSIWFTLGCCEMKLELFSDAIHSFSRCVSLAHDDNGEAWSNLASVHAQQSNWKEAAICITQSARNSSQNWRIWDSYVKIHIQINSTQEVMHGIREMIALNFSENVESWYFDYITEVALVTKASSPLGEAILKFMDEICTKKISNRPHLFHCFARIFESRGMYEEAYLQRMKELRVSIAQMTECFDAKSLDSTREMLKVVGDRCLAAAFAAHVDE